MGCSVPSGEPHPPGAKSGPVLCCNSLQCCQLHAYYRLQSRLPCCISLKISICPAPGAQQMQLAGDLVYHAYVAPAFSCFLWLAGTEMYSKLVRPQTVLSAVSLGTSPIPVLVHEQCPLLIPACLTSCLCPVQVPRDQLRRSSEAGQLGARFHLQQHPGEVASLPRRLPLSCIAAESCPCLSLLTPRL